MRTQTINQPDEMTRPEASNGPVLQQFPSVLTPGRVITSGVSERHAMNTHVHPAIANVLNGVFGRPNEAGGARLASDIDVIDAAKLSRDADAALRPLSSSVARTPNGGGMDAPSSGPAVYIGNETLNRPVRETHTQALIRECAEIFKPDHVGGGRYNNAAGGWVLTFAEVTKIRVHLAFIAGGAA